MILAIHQPEHIPWLGFFYKISQADVFVILDNVQFRKNYFQNRNKIRTFNGWNWITVPVNHKIDSLIKDVAIAESPNWKRKWQEAVHYSYNKAMYFNDYSQHLFDIIKKDWVYISDLNICLIELFCNFLGIKTTFIKASDLGINGKGSNLILEICRKMKAESYLSGISGRDYLNEEDFKQENIKIVYQEFHHPIYKQVYEPFIPCMSIIDLIFNHGQNSLDIIRGKGVPVLEKLFL